MALIASIIKKALKDTGIYLTEGDSIPSDYFNPTLEMLRDVIAELNTQTAIIFSQQSDNVSVTGNKLKFKKYTESEQAIIDGGGTVDITDRLVDFVPLSNPLVYSNGYHLDFVSYRDLLDRSSETCTCYTFNVGHDFSEIIFNANVAGTITILRNVPIEIDNEPYGEVHIPDSYVHYLVTKLAESVAIRYQFTETASIFAQKGERTGNILANNNVNRRPVNINLMAGLNKFRKYGA